MRSAALAGCLALLACGDAPSPVPRSDAAPASPVLLRGTLHARDSSYVLVACGTTAERAVQVSSASRIAEALAAVTQGANDSMYVEFTADTVGGRVVARDTRFGGALTEGSQCNRPRQVFDVDAIGTEPFWHVTLDSAQLVLERADAPLELVFVADTAVTQGALTTIRAHRNEGRARELTLGLLRTECRDGMSDSWYPYRAEVRFGSMALHGCARR